MNRSIVRFFSVALVAVMVCAALVSCTAIPSEDPQKAEELLKNAGYEVKVSEDDALGTIITASKSDGNYISIIYCNSEANADNMWEVMSGYAEEIKADNEDVVFERSENIVYIGTKQAVKDAQ